MANQGTAASIGMTGVVLRQGGWIAALLGLAVYANTLANGFVFDDVPVVQQDQRVKQVAHWGRIWTRDYWAPPQGMEDPRRDILYRPLTLQSYAVNHLFGDGPWHFHLVNVVLFGAICLGVWRLGCELFDDRLGALLGGVLFAVHPIHTEAVANVVGRGELLCTMFMLAALLLWRSDVRRGSLAKAIGACVCVGAALLSKETALTLPLVMVVLDWWWYRQWPNPGSAYWRRRLVRAYVPLGLVLVSYGLLRGQACGGVFASGTITALQNPLTDATVMQRILTPLKLLGLYLWLFVWPDRLCADYSLAALPLAGSLADRLVVAGLAAVVGGVIAAYRSWKRCGQMACMVAMFVACYGVISNAPVLIGVIFAERLFFWPSVVLCLMLGRWGSRGWSWLQRSPGGDEPPNRWVMIAGVVVLVGGLGGRSVLRNRDWASNDTLFASAFLVNPDSAKVLFGYGHTQLDRGDAAGAAELLERGTTIWPGHRGMWFVLALAHRAEHRLDDAAAALEAAALLRIPAQALQFMISDTRLRREGKPSLKELLATARSHAETRPSSPLVRYRLGKLLLEAGRAGEAIEHLRIAYQSAIEADELPLYLADALGRVGRPEEGVEILERSADGRKDSWRGRALLGRLLVRLPGRQQDAIHHARRAVELAPQEAAARIALAEILTDAGRLEDAIDAYQAAAGLLADDRPRRVVRFQMGFLRKRLKNGMR